MLNAKAPPSILTARTAKFALDEIDRFAAFLLRVLIKMFIAALPPT